MESKEKLEVLHKVGESLFDDLSKVEDPKERNRITLSIFCTLGTMILVTRGSTRLDDLVAYIKNDTKSIDMAKAFLKEAGEIN